MIKRERYISRIRPFIDTELVKVLTGIRRSGKSVMLELIKEELLTNGVDPACIISINFEDLRFSHLQNSLSLHEEICKRSREIGKKVYLFFDEIQEVDGWEKCINSFRVALNCDIYITGSNAKLLSGELATYLAGRYVEFVIYPFSFEEFVELYKSVVPNETIEQCFKKYLSLGGMPYLSNISFSPDATRQYLQDVFASILLKDIVKRNQVRDVDFLERIIEYVMTSIGTPLSASSLSRYLRNEGRIVSVETILNYIKYCCDSFLFYRVKREDVRGKQVLASNEKFYIADHGMREAVFGGNIRDINQTLENIVYMELVRRGYLVTAGKVGDKEIDFVCKKNNDKIYVQVAYLLASNETIQREFGVYKQVQDNYPKYVVSLDEFDMSRDGIKHINIREFLLMEKWN